LARRLAATEASAGVASSIGAYRRAPGASISRPLLVDELSDEEAEPAFARLVRKRELLAWWTEPENADLSEDAWACANAREAIREEPW
jgi:hypothetical protein